MTYRVLVVGLGQIGMGYDRDLARHFVLTHARAFATHPEFQLAGGVDSSTERCELFRRYYDGYSGADLSAALEQRQPDVIVIATPTAVHGAVLRFVLKHSKPRLILCEKPLSFDVDEARSMVELCAERHCLLYVNYSRRSEPGAREVKRRFASGVIGSLVKGVAWYSKGLFNNGSHFFNLLEFWLGAMKSFKIVDPGRLWDGSDPEPDLQVTFENGCITFLAAREECFSHHEIHLVTESGRLRYEYGGAKIGWQAALPDPLLEGYRVLAENSEMIQTDSMRSQWHVADQLAAAIAGQRVDACSGAQALQTLDALVAIKNQL